MNQTRPGTQTPRQRNQALYRVLRVIEYLCWSAGTLALAYAVSTVWLSVKFQDSEAKRLESLRQAPVQRSVRLAGDPFGKILIPRIGVSAIIAEGVDEKTLRHAVGHFQESATPEGGGTVALAGHRDTFFRGLAHVRLNDLVLLETPNGRYAYKVVRTTVVGPQHVELVQSSPESDLTLVTCFPFHYIEHAPQRFIVQSVRIPSP